MRDLARVLATAAVVCAIGCTNVVHEPSEQPPKDELRCYDQPVPDGYIRIDSLDAGLAGCPVDRNFNVFQYTAYTKRPKDAKLIVCSDAWPNAGAETEGWQRWSDPYRDEKLCDGRTGRVIDDPNYQNVIVIKKTR